jgi:hypothetical protein
MERKRSNGKRRRVSFRYDPRVFTRLQQICSQVSAGGGKQIERAAFDVGQQRKNGKDSRLSLLLLGYTVEAQPKPAFIREGHVLVLGLPQSSGKTTCIEGLLSKWPGNEHKKKKIIAFISKRGEETFSGFRKIDPFINTNPDADFLSLVVESVLVVKRAKHVSRKINLIMAELCHNAKSLNHVLRNATRMRKRLEKEKYSDKLRRDVCKLVECYLSDILPNQGRPSQEDAEFKFANSIQFDGTDNNNVVMNISGLEDEVQTLVIGSVAYEVLKNHPDALLVVPGAWTIFLSNGSSLGRFHIESLIAEGAHNGNYVITESVIIEEVPLHVRRQMSTILLGYQFAGEEAIDEIRALRDLAQRFQQNRAIRATVEKPLLTRHDMRRLKIGEFCAFPSYVVEKGNWGLNKVSTMASYSSREEAIARAAGSALQ